MSRTGLEAIKRLIKLRENKPIPLSDYMKICSQSAEHGYYSRIRTIGQNGDFVTSPEVSQLFGEMIATWITYESSQNHHKNRLCLLELGPGIGTLAKDIIRTITRLSSLRQSNFELFYV
ncbi:hypothetical protein ACOME3_000193 [Neoechinorhynchus agilis]